MTLIGEGWWDGGGRLRDLDRSAPGKLRRSLTMTGRDAAVLRRVAYLTPNWDTVGCIGRGRGRAERA